MESTDFPSFNEETGLLESLEDTRAMGVSIADALIILLGNGLIQTSIDGSALLDLVASAIFGRSTLVPMSQYEFYVLLMTTLGVPLVTAEKNARLYNLSRIHPVSSKHATRLPEADIDMTVEPFKSSRIMQQLGTPPDKGESARVDLPPDMERFLETIIGEDGRHGSKRDGSGGAGGS